MNYGSDCRSGSGGILSHLQLVYIIILSSESQCLCRGSSWSNRRMKFFWRHIMNFGNPLSLGIDTWKWFIFIPHWLDEISQICKQGNLIFSGKGEVQMRWWWLVWGFHWYRVFFFTLFRLPLVLFIYRDRFVQLEGNSFQKFSFSSQHPGAKEHVREGCICRDVSKQLQGKTRDSPEAAV